jgi:hypothetical protein
MKILKIVHIMRILSMSQEMRNLIVRVRRLKRTLGVGRVREVEECGG